MGGCLISTSSSDVVLVLTVVHPAQDRLASAKRSRYRLTLYRAEANSAGMLLYIRIPSSRCRITELLSEHFGEVVAVAANVAMELNAWKGNVWNLQAISSCMILRSSQARSDNSATHKASRITSMSMRDASSSAMKENL